MTLGMDFPAIPNPLTKQSAYDHICECLAIQKRRSLQKPSSGRCLYRSADGCKCAVGHCIPDDKYKPWMDDGGLCLAIVLSNAGIDYELVSFLKDCQDAHDKNRSAFVLRIALANTADGYGVEAGAEAAITEWA